MSIKMNANTTDHYLMGLPKKHKDSTPLPIWRYKPTQIYNGFRAFERVVMWQLCTWAEARGHKDVRNPLVCSVTGLPHTADDPVVKHNENYYKWGDCRWIKSSVHKEIHLRYNRPDHWFGKLKEWEKQNGKSWVHDLSVYPINLAQALRGHGFDVNTLIDTFLKSLPKNVAPPHGKFYIEPEES